MAVAAMAVLTELVATMAVARVKAARAEVVRAAEEAERVAMRAAAWVAVRTAATRSRNP